MFSTWRVYSHVCISSHFLSSSGRFVMEDEWCNFVVCFQVFLDFFYAWGTIRNMPTVYICEWADDSSAFLDCECHSLIIFCFWAPAFKTVTSLTLEIAKKCIMVLKWDCVTIYIILFALQGELIVFPSCNVS